MSQATSPIVKLVNTFDRPFDNAVATARTCYSSTGIISSQQVGGTADSSEEKKVKLAGKRDALAKSIYEAGHHTTLQHAHFQFSLSNVSRQFIWSFLHAHPFYNSEQVSQRYVEVKPENIVIPPLNNDAHEIYQQTINFQMQAYQELREHLKPIVATAYYNVFPARQKQDKEKCTVTGGTG